MSVALFSLYTLCILYLFAVAVLISTCYCKNLENFHILAKLISSTLFLAISTVGCALGNTSFFLAMFPGLLLCLVGDTLLGVDKIKKCSSYFMAGLTSFLLGHIFLCLAISSISAFKVYDFILPVIAVIITFFLSNIKGMEFGKMKLPSIIYSFFVALLFSKGLFNLISNGISTINLLLFFGTLLFFVSDILILFLCFYHKKFKFTQFLNLLIYYSGMLLLALSVCVGG